MNPLDYARHLASKVVMTGADKQKRIDICNACDQRKVEAFTGTVLCNKCGCVISWKTSLVDQSCPLGKW